jgi:hypothetical protein
MAEEKSYGHSAIVEHWDHVKKDFAEVQIHRKGPRRVVERAARLVSNFRSILSIESYTREQWVAVFGEGSENGPRR